MRPLPSPEQVVALGPFGFRWPDAIEAFEAGWQFDLSIGGRTHRVVHRVGGRVVYGRWRVHTVTWLDGAVEVEGVEADDYPATRALLSVLRGPDKRHLRDLAEVPDAYEGFEVVNHRREIDAPYSRNSLAVKIREDDLARWGTHAWLRHRSRVQQSTGPARVTPARGRLAEPAAALPPPPALEHRAVVAALLAHGQRLAADLGGGSARFTADDEANDLIHADPFAFLVAVLCDQGIVAERAWAVPYQLRQRLGHLDPARIGREPDAVHEAFATPPKLHRFVNNIAEWVSTAGSIVTDRYGGDAARLWGDHPPAAALRERLEAFPGIGQKKAAMAVEMLERDLGVSLTALHGSDVAYDVHIRRVFLRTGLAERDDVGHMVGVARTLHPDRPGELDNPAWDVGRRWCHRDQPACSPCPLLTSCARCLEIGRAVRGV